MITPLSKSGVLPPFLRRFRSLLGQGLTPVQLAWALSLGAVVGISPLLWGTGLLCAAFAAKLRLNQAAIQLANVAVWPLQISLFIPWLRLGGWISGTTPGSLPNLEAPPAELVRSYGEANLQGLLAWFFVAPLAVALSFPLLYLICRYSLIRRSAGEEKDFGDPVSNESRFVVRGE